MARGSGRGNSKKSKAVATYHTTRGPSEGRATKGINNLSFLNFA